MSSSSMENQKNHTDDSSNVKGKHAPTETDSQTEAESPFFQAKRAQLVERNPDKAIELFKSAMDLGDRVDSALKDMVYVMKGQGRTDEAIKAIKANWNHVSPQSKESLNNVLINLCKKAGRIDEHIKLLQHKIKLIEEGSAFGGTGTKIVRVGRRELHVPIELEKSRLLGSLAWLYMKKKNYHMAEPLLREALDIEPDKNKECNLAICLMKYRGRVSEARAMLQAVRHSSEVQGMADSYVKSYNRAWNILTELESQSVLNYPSPHHLPQHHFPHYPPPHHFPHYPPPHHFPQPSHQLPPPPPQHPQHHFLHYSPPHQFPPHHLPQPSHHLPPPPPQHPQHHFPPHNLPQHPQPFHPPPQPSPPPSPPSPPPLPAILDVNPMVSPYDNFDNRYSYMPAFRGLEMVPWRRR